MTGTALVILQAHLDGGLAGIAVDGEILDVAFVLQHLGQSQLDPRRGRGDLGLARELAVANAGEEVRDGIRHAHAVAPVPGLPAGLAEARDVTAHRGFAQLLPPETELAVDATGAAGDRAAVAHPRRGRIARHGMQLALRLLPLGCRSSSGCG